MKGNGGARCYTNWTREVAGYCEEEPSLPPPPPQHTHTAYSPTQPS
jgi:hypothetical protein